MIGMRFASSLSSALMASVASRPSISGMRISISMAEYLPGSLFSNISRATLPFSARSAAMPSISRISIMISAFMSISSASSRHLPWSAACFIDPAALCSAAPVISPEPPAFLNVTVTANSVPTPFSDSTSIVPFIISTRFFVMAMPRPVLPYLFFLLSSSCVKASKILGM